jgi:hypothetical protein
LYDFVRSHAWRLSVLFDTLALTFCNQSSATVIVSPHGGISSNLLFSNDGAAALLLVQFTKNQHFFAPIPSFIKSDLQVGPGDKQRRGAKDTNIYPWLTWLTVRYWLGTGNQVRQGKN